MRIRFTDTELHAMLEAVNAQLAGEIEADDDDAADDKRLVLERARAKMIVKLTRNAIGR